MDTTTDAQSRYNIKWIGHCTFDDSDKIWGWFSYNDPTESESLSRDSLAYVFWARTGKTLSYKKHTSSYWNMQKLQRKKIDRKYKEIAQDQLLILWPSFFTDLDNTFIFHLLANDI
jgi:hypothetical protein